MDPCLPLALPPFLKLSCTEKTRFWYRTSTQYAPFGCTKFFFHKGIVRKEGKYLIFILHCLCQSNQRKYVMHIGSRVYKRLRGCVYDLIFYIFLRSCHVRTHTKNNNPQRELINFQSSGYVYLPTGHFLK